MPRKFVPPDPQHIIDLYRSGLGTEDVAKQLPFPISSAWVYNFLRDEGVLRTRQEAMDLVFAKRTPEQHTAWTAAAHDAVRGSTRTEESLCRGARTRFEKQLGVSEVDRMMAEWLRPHESILQKDVGRYNVDVLVNDTVAVELLGHSSHNRGGPQSARAADRAKYILSTGLNLLYVWITEGDVWRLRREAADYALAFLEKTSSDPAFRGEYRVIWGDGEAAPHSGDLNDLASMPPRGSGFWPAPGKLDKS